MSSISKIILGRASIEKLPKLMSSSVSNSISTIETYLKDIGMKQNNEKKKMRNVRGCVPLQQSYEVNCNAGKTTDMKMYGIKNCGIRFI